MVRAERPRAPLRAVLQCLHASPDGRDRRLSRRDARRGRPGRHAPFAGRRGAPPFARGLERRRDPDASVARRARCREEGRQERRKGEGRGARTRDVRRVGPRLSRRLRPREAEREAGRAGIRGAENRSLQSEALAALALSRESLRHAMGRPTAGRSRRSSPRTPASGRSTCTSGSSSWGITSAGISPRSSARSRPWRGAEAGDSAILAGPIECGGSSSVGRASDCGSECRGFDPRLPPQPSFSNPRAPVAQLDRASDSGSEGLRFESGRAHRSPRSKIAWSIRDGESVRLLVSPKTLREALRA